MSPGVFRTTVITAVAAVVAVVGVTTASAAISDSEPWAGSPEVAAKAGDGGPIYDIESIAQRKAQAFRALDDKDWTAMRGLLAEDAVLEIPKNEAPNGEDNVIEGADEIISFLRRTHDGGVHTIHHGYTPEIEMDSETEAKGIWAMEDLYRFPNGLEIQGFGHYHEEYEKVDGNWVIKKSTLTRTRLDRVKPGGPLNLVNGTVNGLGQALIGAVGTLTRTGAPDS